MAAHEQGQPPQEQDRQPGREGPMRPAPDFEPRFPGSGRLAGKVALVTGGDSGIGRAVCVLFAREGADIACCYLDETEDARATKAIVEREGRRCLTLAGDVGDPAFARDAVARTLREFGKLQQWFLRFQFRLYEFRHLAKHLVRVKLRKHCE